MNDLILFVGSSHSVWPHRRNLWLSLAPRPMRYSIKNLAMNILMVGASEVAESQKFCFYQFLQQMKRARSAGRFTFITHFDTGIECQLSSGVGNWLESLDTVEICEHSRSRHSYEYDDEIVFE